MRRGYGKGLGMGYKNLLPMDSHIHSLSAKGVKRYYITQYGFVWKISRDDLIKLAREGSQKGYVEYDKFNAKELKRIPTGLYRPYPENDRRTEVESASNDAKLYHMLDWTEQDFKELYDGLTKGRKYRDLKTGKTYYELDAKAKIRQGMRAIMMNPKTGRILQGEFSHGQVLREQGVDNKEVSKKIYDYVRAIYVPQRKTLFIRHYFKPETPYAEFTPEDFNRSEELQKRLVDRLQLPKGTKVVYNTTNTKLREEGFINY